MTPRCRTVPIRARIMGRGGNMPESTRRLVIVESPAKAKTIQGYLGEGFEVTASVGHIRDLPDKAADIPGEVQGHSAVGASGRGHRQRLHPHLCGQR